MTFKTESAFIEVPLGEHLPLDFAPREHLVNSDRAYLTPEGLHVDWGENMDMPEKYQVYLKWSPVAVAVWIDEEEEPNDE